MIGRLLLPIGGLFILALFMGRKAAASEIPMKNSQPITPLAPSFTRYDALFKKYGQQFGVSWRLLKVIATIESTLGENPRVALGLRDPSNKASVSYDNLSWGLMQLRVETANDYEKGTTYADLNNAETSIRIAAKFFAWIQRQFPRTDSDWLKKVVMSYNQGVAGTKRGYTGALPYWEKFQKQMALLNDRQPE
jgi:hypothetical protein